MKARPAHRQKRAPWGDDEHWMAPPPGRKEVFVTCCVSGKVIRARKGEKNSEVGAPSPYSWAYRLGG